MLEAGQEQPFKCDESGEHRNRRDAWYALDPFAEFVSERQAEGKPEHYGVNDQNENAEQREGDEPFHAVTLTRVPRVSPV